MLTDGQRILPGLDVPETNGVVIPRPEVMSLPLGELSLGTLALLQTEATSAHRKHGTGSILAGRRDLAYMLACGMEELGEVARAMVDGEGIERVIAEWLQVANVGISSVQAIKRHGIVR
jgi:hypothetical protein